MRIFISHITEESALASVIQRMIEQTFPSKCHVFRSSDPYSLGPGVRWEQTTRSALEESALVISLLSPSSLKRWWISVEIGAAWIKGIAVVPVIHSGLRFSDLKPPISMYQGVDLFDDACLEDILQLVSDAGSIGGVPAINFESYWLDIRSALAVSMDPKSTVMAWNRALLEDNLSLAESLTSKTASEYVKKTWGSLQGLADRYTPDSIIGLVIEHEAVGDGIARVKYTTVYEGPEVKIWEDVLFWEDGSWKLAPQFVVAQSRTLRHEKE